MKYIDLHIHSNFSDGTLTPKEIVELAYSSQLSAIALTDHDTVDGIKEAQETVDKLLMEGKKLCLIPGIEMTVEYRERDIHILGLFIDTMNPDFVNSLKLIRERRDIRNEKMIKELNNAGINITIEALRVQDGDVVFTRSHIAKFLVLHGYANNREDAFSRFLRRSTPFYVKREQLTPQEGIRIIHEAGGLAILAHPLLYGYGLDEIETMVASLSKLGLDGIEALYSLNNADDERNILKLADKYNLTISGGSDFHGENKAHISMGTGLGNLKVPYEVFEKLKKEL